MLVTWTTTMQHLVDNYQVERSVETVILKWCQGNCGGKK